jgi:hypothetical protein
LRGGVAASLAQAAAPEASSDEMLIRRIAQGDQLAMRTLFGRHRVPLYRWLLRLVGDEALAEDLLSDVFLDVWRQAAALSMQHRDRERLKCAAPKLLFAPMMRHATHIDDVGERACIHSWAPNYEPNLTVASGRLSFHGHLIADRGWNLFRPNPVC